MSREKKEVKIDVDCVDWFSAIVVAMLQVVVVVHGCTESIDLRAALSTEFLRTSGYIGSARYRFVLEGEVEDGHRARIAQVNQSIDGISGLVALEYATC